MSSVWVVTSGDYSDYSINGVYRTEEAAEAWVKNEISGSYLYGVEEWKFLDDEPLRNRIEVLILGYTGMKCRWDELPRVRRMYGLPRGSPPIGEVIERTDKFMEESGRQQYGYPEGVPECQFDGGWHDGVLVAAVVFGTDHERVRKVMSEKAGMIKAQAYLVGGE